MDTPPPYSTPSLSIPVFPAHLTYDIEDITSPFDDDIQYLGTKPAPVRLNSNFLPFPRVDGIVLRIQSDFNYWKKESDIPSTMTFHKSDTGVVHIGRRPAVDSRVLKEYDPKSNAMFRCAVVSRIHARIVFTETGHVYMVDLKSHHGTHIRRPGDAISTMLKPETPTPVYNGDFVTFGKSVGKGDDLVRPVVVEVELLYPTRPTSAIFKPLSLPGESFPFVSSILGRTKSGSYGLRELDSPSPSPQPVEALKEAQPGDNKNANKPAALAPENSPSLSQASENNSNGGNSQGSLGRALDAIKRFLPPTRMSPAVRLSPFLSHAWGDQSSDIDNSQGDLTTDHPESGSESSDSSYSIHSSASSSPQPSSPTPLQAFDLGDAPADIPTSKSIVEFPPCDIFGDIAQLAQEHFYRARSFSPMDLATPASPPASNSILHPIPHHLAVDPPIIGAWPISNSSSRRASRCSSPSPILPPLQNLGRLSPAISLSSDMALASDDDDKLDKGKGREIIDVDEDCLPGIVSICPSPVSARSASPIAFPVSAQFSGQISTLNASIDDVQTRLGKLQGIRQEHKHKFDLYCDDISAKLEDSNDRISALEDQFRSLSDRIDLVIDEDISTLRYQLDQLQEQSKAPPPTEGEVASKLEAQRDVQCLNEFVAEMKRSHETTLQEMEERVSAVNAAHDLALANFTQWEAQMQAQMKQCQESLNVASSLSRKRKRDDDVDDDDGESSAQQDERLSSPGESDMEIDGRENASTASSASSVEDETADCENSTLVTGKDGISVPSPKRARRVVNAVARTATAVTVGAFVAWSALAFT